MSEPLLLHTCCAPCTTFVLPTLQQEDFEVTCFFFNPNIHPIGEYSRRKEAMHHYLSSHTVPLVVPFPYQPIRFFSVISNQASRCLGCYTVRLEHTARWACDRGVKYFSTTLSISPYQDIATIHRLGERIGREFQLSFVARDFRNGFSKSQEMARTYGLYRQRYCGCIYSFWEGVDRATWKTLNGGVSS